jgi:gliding motility-associated-like protein
MKEKILTLFIGLLVSFSGHSQITSNVKAAVTDYSSSDSVFVFCTDDPNGGSLIAEDSTGHGGYTFEWFKYNYGTHNFTDALSGDDVNGDATQSTLSNLANGGYKVVLTNVDTVQEYVGWVFINNGLTLDLELYDENDCNIAGVLANPYYPYNNTFATSFIYEDPSTNIQGTLNNKIEDFDWDSNTEPEIVRFNSASLFVTNLPWENTIYSLVATDKFGCVVSDDIDYTAIATKADFTWNHIDDKTLEVLANGGVESSLEGSAPLEVHFFNEAKNSIKFRWDFGDSTAHYELDSLNMEPIHTYYYTNDTGKTYTMELYSESEYGCKDSVSFSLKVLPTKLEFPNVFTPNGDPYNNVFILTDYQSIRDFKIVIFNRAGQIVHEYEGDVRDWEGWKGKVKNTGKKAPAGSYYFVVEVRGWDNKNYNNDNITSGSESEEINNQSSVKFGIVALYR